MFSQQQQQQLQQHGTAMAHPPRLQNFNGPLSGGTSLRLITGAKTLYSTLPPPSLHCLSPMQAQLRNGNANGFSVKLRPSQEHVKLTIRSPFQLSRLISFRLVKITIPFSTAPLHSPSPPPPTAPNVNNNTLLTTLTHTLAPPSLRLSHGVGIRNVDPHFGALARQRATPHFRPVQAQRYRRITLTLVKGMVTLEEEQVVGKRTVYVQFWIRSDAGVDGKAAFGRVGFSSTS
ncbi:hypothetical protein M407DRAFT_30904 [Tulasnella calospora MUT 4182]|uniref:Uncharacterized protein n=1 Tax=Tulasnella calospora MUT 4182 TaxID=1051891 RepID=A0A0C3Q6K0_9AGAM|nr:hypothetical protein M407DRAFT_30904 [Tulasnella calospora MUT 4182]